MHLQPYFNCPSFSGWDHAGALLVFLAHARMTLFVSSKSIKINIIGNANVEMDFKVGLVFCLRWNSGKKSWCFFCVRVCVCARACLCCSTPSSLKWSHDMKRLYSGSHHGPIKFKLRQFDDLQYFEAKINTYCQLSALPPIRLAAI